MAISQVRKKRECGFHVGWLDPIGSIEFQTTIMYLPAYVYEDLVSEQEE